MCKFAFYLLKFLKTDRTPESNIQLPHQRQPIADRQQARIDPRIVPDTDIERPNCVRRRIVQGVIHQTAAPQHVVDGDDAAGPQQNQALFVVIDIVFLVAVDEGEALLAKA